MSIARAALGAALALCVAVASGVASAQSPPAAPLVGFLPLGSAGSAYDRSLVEAFRQGLRDAGIVEQRDVTLEVVWTASELEVVPAVVKLGQRGAKLFIPVGTTASMAVKRYAPQTPMLFISVGNPLGIGLVESLSRPGANVTGFGDSLADIGGKYVQFATAMTKPQTPLQYLWHAGWPDGYFRLQKTEEAARSVGAKLRTYSIMEAHEVDDAMAAIRKAGATIVIIQPSPFTFRERERLVASAMNHGLGTIFAFRDAVRVGALMAYGPDYADLNRRASSYLARILKGTKPGDLPVEQPTKFELLINLRTAKALNLTIPPSLLLQADHVLE